MTEEEIKRIVRETIIEFREQEMIRDSDEVIMDEMSDRLKAFFSGKQDFELGKVLQEVSSDYYFEIIPLQFQQGMNITSIAKYLNADRVTIWRNKKRLLRGIYTMLK